MNCCEALARQLAGLGRGFSQLLVEHGRAFTSAPCPAEIPKGPMGQCYASAGRLIISGETDLIYCEGYGYRPGLIPLPHAWCVTADGIVVDPTWPDSAECEYFGVPLSEPFVRRTILKTRVWGVLHEVSPRELQSMTPADFVAPQFLLPKPAGQAQPRAGGMRPKTCRL